MKIVKKHWAIVMLLLISNSSCFREEIPFDARGLTYRGQFVYDSQFKMNGAWYHIREDGGVGIRYFFKNGVAFSSGAGNFNVNDIQCWQIPSRLREIPWHWGFFIVIGDTIKIQTFHPAPQGWSQRRQVEEWWARIENDTTIYVFKRIFPRGNTMSHSLRFHFHHCVNKPDSTNVLLW